MTNTFESRARQITVLAYVYTSNSNGRKKDFSSNTFSNAYDYGIMITMIFQNDELQFFEKNNLLQCTF